MPQTPPHSNGNVALARRYRYEALRLTITRGYMLWHITELCHKDVLASISAHLLRCEQDNGHAAFSPENWATVWTGLKTFLLTLPRREEGPIAARLAFMISLDRADQTPARVYYERVRLAISCLERRCGRLSEYEKWQWLEPLFLRPTNTTLFKQSS